MKCEFCGNEIDNDNKICAVCGARIIINNKTGESYTMPAIPGTGPGIPKFVAPQSGSVTAPTPNNIPDIPSFSAPGTGNSTKSVPNNVSDIPSFSTPESGNANKSMGNNPSGIPQFKAPAGFPSFAAPRMTGYPVQMCYYHGDEQSVGNCARCGKNLCKDCCDSYGVIRGQYAGKHLCYDCTQELVQENVTTLEANYATIKNRYIVCSVGCIIGALIGFAWGMTGGFASAIIYGILCGAIGGSAGNFFRSFFAAVPGFFVSTGNIALSIVIGMIKFGFCFWWYALKAFGETFSKLFYYKNYMNRTAGIIESDSATLRQMQEYMEYSMIRQKNRGVDLDTLMQQGSQLYDNSFAKMVRDQGEDQAEAYMRQCVTRIAENGEIIRDFAA